MIDEKPWIEKYRPKTTVNMVGAEKIKNQIIKFLDNFESKKSKIELMKSTEKALLLIGPPGIGKTTIVHAIGNEYGYEVKEMNASDSRKKADVHNIIGMANSNESLFFFLSKIKSKIIFVDEVDGISGNEDKGGLTELISAIEKTSYPIILAGNYRNDKTSKLEKISTVIHCDVPTKESIKNQLKLILSEEKISYEELAIDKIVDNSKGDFRSAINDAQLISKWKGCIKEESLDINSERDTLITDDDMILKVVNSLSTEDGLYYLKSNDLVYEELLKRIGDAIMLNNPTSELMDVIIKANEILKYVRKEANYSMLKYFFYQIASIGIFRSDAPVILRTPTEVWRRRKRESTPIIKKIQNVIPLKTDEIYNFVIPILKISFDADRELMHEVFSINEKEWSEVEKFS